jgi:hypothetical protein
MILTVNPGVNPDRIFIGQTLYLPAHQTQPAAPEPVQEAPVQVRQKGKTTGANLHLIPISSKATTPE